MQRTTFALLATLSIAAHARDYTFEIDSSPYSRLGAGRTVEFDGTAGIVHRGFRDIPLPFDFPFFASTHSTVRITTSGYLTFNPQSGQLPGNTVLPSGIAPQSVIAPWWDDLEVNNHGTDDEVSWEVSGVVPNRRVTVQWLSMSRRGESASDHHYANFQATLHENGSIDFHYGISGTQGTPADFSASLGIENESGTHAVAPFGGQNDLGLADMPEPNTKITFRRVPVSSYSIEIVPDGYTQLDSQRVTLWRGDIAPTIGDFRDVPIGFGLNVFGETHSTLRVSSNGYATFPPGSGVQSGNAPLPAPPLTGEIALCPWWDNLEVADQGTTDEISYRIVGNPGQRRMIVEWRSISMRFQSAANHTFVYFQLHLVEDGDLIEFRYGNSGMSGMPTIDYSATVGIQDAAAAETHEPFYDSPVLALADFPQSGTVIRFTPRNAPPEPLQFVTTTLPSPVEGRSYGLALLATGGTPPYSWQDFGLPVGLSLSPSGILSGVAPPAGTYRFDIEVEDYFGRKLREEFTLVTNPEPIGGLCGDCDESGAVSILDALAAARHDLGVAPLSSTGRTLCDVDPSPGVTILDALRIAQSAAGLSGLSCP